MGLSGKLVSQTSVKSSGNAFFDIFKNPHKFSNIAPDMIDKVDLERGQWGTVGSIVCWHFTHEGKNMISREMVEAVDEEKKSITYSLMEGDLMDAYKTLKVIVDVDNINGMSCMVTFTIAYEKKTEAMPVPHSLMDANLSLANEIEGRHLLASKL